MEIKLAKAEVKALCHYAKTEALTLAQRSTRSDFTFPGQQSVADKRQEEAERWSETEAADFERWKRDDTDDMLGALDVFGILSISLQPFGERAAWAQGVEVIHVEFSEAAIRWLTDRRDELAGSLGDRRASVEISGGTRNETFVLFVLDTIAVQLASSETSELKAAA